MSDFTSSTVLYHPSGARCTLTLPSDPLAAFEAVNAYIEAGFLANVPIPKEGQRCHIDYVIRCKFIHNNKQGERLYFYDLSSQFSSSAMTVYLDDPDMIKAFERASGLTVESMPFVEGKLVPTSDSGAFFQQYACPVNFTVLREKVDVTAENPNGRWKLIDYVSSPMAQNAPKTPLISTPPDESDETTEDYEKEALAYLKDKGVSIITVMRSLNIAKGAMPSKGDKDGWSKLLHRYAEFVAAQKAAS